MTKTILRKVKLTTKGRTENMTKLRERMVDAFDALASAAIPTEQAKELANTAGKIISSAKAQLEYAHARKEKPEIPFLK